MQLMFWITTGVIVNLVVGCMVCAHIDDDEQRLYQWYKKGPDCVAWLVPFLWPITAYFWIKGNKQ